MTVVTKTIGRLPMNKGDWDANYVNPKTGQNGYGLKFRTIRYGCELESKMENNTYDPIAWDGAETFTVDTAHWLLISGSPEAWLDGQDKPATTGTTGDYPYNGMGQVVLKKHIVEVGGVEKNLLYQDDFKKGPAGARVDNENTVFVIKYDFELAEDITIPVGCVLDFQGGSISGAHTLTLNDCQIIGTNRCFGTDISFVGKSSSACQADWFIGSDAEIIEKALTTFSVVALAARDYNITRQIVVNHSFSLKGLSIPDFFGDHSQTRLIGNFEAENLEDRSILKLTKASVDGFLSFTVEDISFTSAVSLYINGINITTPGGPSRPCLLKGCNFKNLNYGVYVFGSNATNSTNIGQLNIISCNFAYNNWGLYFTGRNAVGGLTVMGCVIEQNAIGGIYSEKYDSGFTACSELLLTDVLLEGQPQPLTMATTGVVRIDRCYFERSDDATTTVTLEGVNAFGNKLYMSNTSSMGNLVLDIKGYTIEEWSNTFIPQLYNVKLENCTVNSKIDNILSCKNCSFLKSLYQETSIIPDVSFTLSKNFCIKNKPNYRKCNSTTDEDYYFSKTIPAGTYRTVQTGKANGINQFVKVGSGVIQYFNCPNENYVFVNDITIDSEISGINSIRISLRNSAADVINAFGSLYLFDMNNIANGIPIVNDDYDMEPVNHTDIINPSYGCMVIDSVLNKPVWWNGTDWVDATGTTV